MFRRFRDRDEAGRLLARELEATLHGSCIIAAIPRGGVSVALPIAELLRAPLFAIFTHKLGAPSNPELAFGAVDEDGVTTIDALTVSALDIAPEEIADVKKRVIAEIEERRATYQARPLAPHLAGADVVLVDDGLATGLTMKCALAYVRRHGASRAIVATPCASDTAARYFGREADAFVSLVVDRHFGAVGAYFDDFGQVTDDEVAAALSLAARETMPRAAPQDPRGSSSVVP